MIHTEFVNPKASGSRGSAAPAPRPLRRAGTGVRNPGRLAGIAPRAAGNRWLRGPRFLRLVGGVCRIGRQGKWAGVMTAGKPDPRLDARMHRRMGREQTGKSV